MDPRETTAVIVDATGRPARTSRPVDTSCPRCGKGADTRVASAGFGSPHPVCPCGYEWVNEVWHA